MQQELLNFLSPEYPWAHQISYFPSLGSTNDVLKALAKHGAPHGTAIVAGSQTNGHGRMDRSFHSPEGMGLYLSLLLRPECPATALMHLTCATAVAACNAVETTTALRPGIKWTNDLVCGTRKLGGILTELGFTPKGTVDFCIIGIGINCRQQTEDFPPELRSMAGSLGMVTGMDISPARLAAALLEELHTMSLRLLQEQEALLDAYRKDCITIGQEISILRGEEIRHGKALSVDEQGGLVVEYADGSVSSVTSGEVSIRGMYGYV